MWLDGGVETYVDGLMKMIVFEFDEPSFDELGGGGDLRRIIPEITRLNIRFRLAIGLAQRTQPSFKSVDQTSLQWFIAASI